MGELSSYKYRFTCFSFICFLVGAGSAGSVVAARLSEDPCVSVLLLEAGGPADPISEIPAAAFLLQNGPSDWGYKTIPQKRGADGYENRVSKCLKISFYFVKKLISKVD